MEFFFSIVLLINLCDSCSKLRCAIKPKLIVNVYEERLKNYVQPNPFSSACLKCSMCLAVAKEYDQIFTPTCENGARTLQTEVVKILETRTKELCKYGFENYDLRRFNKHQAVSDQHDCSTHVTSAADGKWTQKLREVCGIYLDHIDYQHLLNMYLNKTGHIANYLCRNKGIFRDCASLSDQGNNFVFPETEDQFFNLCEY